MDPSLPDPAKDFVSNTSDGLKLLTSKGSAEIVLATTTLSLSLANAPDPTLALLALGTSLGLNFLERRRAKKGAAAELDVITLEVLLKEIRYLGTHVAELKKIQLTDLAARHSVAAARAAAKGELPPQPNDLTGIYHRLFQLPDTVRATPEAQADAIMALVQDAIAHTPALQQQQSAPGVSEATFIALGQLLKEHHQQLANAITLVGKEVTAADRRSQKRDASTHSKLDQILAQMQKPAPAIEAANQARSVAGPGASAEDVRAQAAQTLGLTAGQFADEVNREGADNDAVLKEIEAIKKQLAPSLATLDDAHRKALTRRGDAKYASGNYREAIAPYRQALALVDKGANWNLWSTVAWNLSLTLIRQREDADAEVLLHQLLDDHIAREGENSLNALTLANNLASLLSERGDKKGGEVLCRRAVKQMERILGSEHPHTLGALNNLANILSEQEKWDEAEQLFRRVLKLRESILGNYHPETTDSANNLAVHLRNVGKLGGAEVLNRRVLAHRQLFFGAEHPKVLLACYNLAALLYDKGELREALELMKRAAAGQASILGAQHPDTVDSIKGMKKILHKMKAHQ